MNTKGKSIAKTLLLFSFASVAGLLNNLLRFSTFIKVNVFSVCMISFVYFSGFLFKMKIDGKQNFGILNDFWFMTLHYTV